MQLQTSLSKVIPAPFGWDCGISAKSDPPCRIGGHCRIRHIMRFTKGHHKAKPVARLIRDEGQIAGQFPDQAPAEPAFGQVVHVMHRKRYGRQRPRKAPFGWHRPSPVDNDHMQTPWRHPAAQEDRRWNTILPDITMFRNVVQNLGQNDFCPAHKIGTGIDPFDPAAPVQQGHPDRIISDRHIQRQDIRGARAG